MKRLGNTSTKVISLLFAVLLCFVFSLVLPTSGSASELNHNTRSSFTQAEKVPFILIAGENCATTDLCLSPKVDKLFLAKIAGYLLKQLYPLLASNTILLPVSLHHERNTLLGTILTKGP